MTDDTYVVIAKSNSCKQKNGRRCVAFPLIVPYTINKVIDKVHTVIKAPISISARKNVDQLAIILQNCHYRFSKPYNFKNSV